MTATAARVELPPRPSTRPARPRRVLQLITRPDAGGAQAVAIDLARGLSARGHDVWLGCGRRGTGESWLDGLPCPIARFAALDRPLRPGRDLAALASLVRWLRRRQIDVVHTHTSKAGILGRLAAALAGVPVVLHSAHGWPFVPGQARPTAALYRGLERLAARRSSHVLAVSEATRARGAAAGITHLCVSYCGIHLDRHPFSAAARPRVVGGVACLKPQKDPLAFVEVAARLARQDPAVRFELIGDGPLRPAVARRAEALGLGRRLTLLGWRDDVAHRLAGWRALLLTSRWEGLPLAVLEAMAVGTPVVATAVDGTPEAVVDGQTGFLFAPGDTPRAAACVERLLATPALARQLAAAARQRVLRFDRARHVDRVAALIEDGR